MGRGLDHQMTAFDVERACAILAARIVLGHVVQVLQLIWGRLGVDRANGVEQARGSNWQGG